MKKFTRILTGGGSSSRSRALLFLGIIFAGVALGTVVGMKFLRRDEVLPERYQKSITIGDPGTRSDSPTGNSSEYENDGIRVVNPPARPKTRGGDGTAVPGKQPTY